MNVLVIGSGGREHALCWSISKSERVDKLYCAPGNAGIAEDAKCVEVDPSKSENVIDFAKEKDIGLVVIGPEDPLVAGLADDLKKAGIKAFGPGKEAARLEGSKAFTKDLCAKYQIPTARYKKFTDPNQAKAHLETTGTPIVIKADGLAAGKGVIIAEDRKSAHEAIEEMFEGRFGEAGKTVVLEEKLEGEEASFIALVDGKNILPLATSQDHKRAFDGDEGPNTGGMGAYSPAPVMKPEITDQVMADIMVPTVQAMKMEGHPYQGVLYAGLMITGDGPKLIEFNCRFGDPECQVILMRLASDIVPAMLATVDGSLKEKELSWRDEVALTVIMASRGYPGSYKKGTEIKNLKEAGKGEGIKIFHAGTGKEDGKILATGGRVLNVTALGETVSKARDRAYEAVKKIDWPEGFCRKDIGWQAIEREKEK